MPLDPTVQPRFYQILYASDRCQSCILLSAAINSFISLFVHSHSCLSPVETLPWKSNWKYPHAFGFPVQRPPLPTHLLFELKKNM